MIEIIYADSDIIVINKPPGIAIHPVRRQPRHPVGADVPPEAGRTSNGVHSGGSVSGPTVVDFLLKNFPELRKVGEDPLRPGIVHRLDKDTSGVMVVARNQEKIGRAHV